MECYHQLLTFGLHELYRHTSFLSCADSDLPIDCEPLLLLQPVLKSLLGKRLTKRRHNNRTELGPTSKRSRSLNPS